MEALLVQRLAGAGRAVIAARDLPAGTEVLRAAPYAWAAYSHGGARHCSACCKQVDDADASRCGACKQAYYCSRVCQREDWTSGQHKAECTALARLAASRPGHALPPTILLGSRILRRLARERAAGCRVADGSPPAVEASDADAVAPLDAVARARLAGPAGVLALEGNRAAHRLEQLEEYAHMAPGVVALLAAVGDQPAAPPAPGLAPPAGNSAASSGGAAEAATHGPDAPAVTASDVIATFCKVRCNVFTICDAEFKPRGIGLFPLGALFNHSCAPNCVALYDSHGGGTTVTQLVRTIAPVRAGEQLTIAYVDVGMPTPLRQHDLQDSYFFVCRCARCERFAGAAAREAASSSAGALPASGEGPAHEGASGGASATPAHCWSDADAALMAVRCAATPRCAGVAIVPRSVLGPLARGASAAATGGHMEPLPCSACGKRVAGEQLAAIELLCGRALSLCGAAEAHGRRVPAPTVAAQPSGDRVLADGPILLRQLGQAVGEHHHARLSLANAVVNALIAAQDWPAAARVNGDLVAGLDVAHGAVAGGAAGAACNPTAPLPALQHAIQGKLLLFLERPAEAAPHLEHAVRVLRITHGERHALVGDLATLAAQAAAEAGRASSGSAAPGAGGPRAAGKTGTRLLE